MSAAIYPGTFDPITLGHADIIRRAVGLFDRLLVAVAASPGKAPLFDLEQRLELIRAVVGHHTQVEVQAFSGLLVDLARQRDIPVILRGVRTGSDFEYEHQLANVYRRLNPDLEILFLSPREQYACISSSFVREIAALGGNLSSFVHPVVQAALSARFS